MRVEVVHGVILIDLLYIISGPNRAPLCSEEIATCVQFSVAMLPS